MQKALAIFVRDARIGFSYPLTFWMQWVSIFVAVVGFWFVSRLVPPSAHLGTGGARGSYFDYVVVNVAFFSMQATALQSFSRAIRRDQYCGTLEPLLTTPTPLPLLVCAASLWPFIITVLQVCWYLVLASTVFGLRLGGANVGLSLVVVALIITSSSAVGIVSAAAIMQFKQNGPANLLVGGAASLLSGVLFPVVLLPAPLRVMAWFLPITHGLAAIRAALAGGTWQTSAPDLLWLACASAILLPAALAMFRVAVHRCRVDGTLGHY